MPIILTSNGLTSKAIVESYSKLLADGFRKVAIVVTADPEHKERHWKAVSTKNELEKMGSALIFLILSSHRQIYCWNMMFCT